MKHFFLGIVMALVLALSSVPAMTSPAEAASPSCTNKQSHRSTLVTAGPAYRRARYDINVSLGYQRCYNPGPGKNWVRPKWMRATIYPRGEVNCYNWIGEVNLDNFQFTAYFKDRTGRNYRKPRWSVDCEKRRATGIVYYGSRTTPRLFHSSEGQPQWKANITANWRNFKDGHGSVTGYMDTRRP